MNQISIIGRITRDPEIKYTQSNIGYVGFSLAVNRPYKDENGNPQVDFINCAAWKNQAEFLARYITKGNLLAVQGALQTRSYTTQNGENRVITEVVVTQVENLTPREPIQNPIPPKPAEKPKEPTYTNTNTQPNSFGIDDDDSGLPWL